MTMSGSQQASSVGESLELFSTRLRPSVQQRVRLAAGLQQSTIQQFIGDLCDEHVPTLDQLSEQVRHRGV